MCYRGAPRGIIGDVDWKARYQELKSRHGALKQALAAEREKNAALKAFADSLRADLEQAHVDRHVRGRRILKSTVLQDLLALRAGTRLVSSADRQREADFLLRSESYREARDAPPPEGALLATVHGLTWTVPRDERRERSLSDRILRGWLPLSHILSTREMIARGAMLDIGANVGTTSVPRAILGDFDVIYAAEPDPDNYACLVRAVIDNGLAGVVLPDRVALDSETRTARLHRSASIGQHALSVGGDDVVEVAAMTLDGWLDRLAVPVEDVRYVKLDTQGRESHILEGATTLLGRRGVVWEIECAPYLLELAGRSLGHLVEQLAASFSTFIDLNPEAPGARVRSIRDLGDALGYLAGTAYTDLLVYRA